jgi:hypothetical protein
MIGNSFGAARGATLSAALELARRFACVWVLMLLGANVAPQPALAGQPMVSGRVTDHLTGEPIAGLRLSVYYNSTPFSTEEIGAPVTDADGRYAWAGSCPLNPPFPCYVEGYAEGYLYTTRSFQQSDSDVTVDLAMIRAAQVSGDFTIDGQAADHAIGAAIEFFNEDSGQWTSPAPITYEEADGHYAIGRLPYDHDYRVCAGGPNVDVVRQCWDGHEQTSLSGDPGHDPVILDEGEQRGGVDFDFRSGGAIEGTLRDAYLAAPLANRPINILVYDDAGNWVDGAARTTDADGHYRVAGLPDGSYYIAVHAMDDVFSDNVQLYPAIVCADEGCEPATDGEEITIANGATIGAIDFTFHPDVVVEGRVTDAATGAGLGGIHVVALYDFYPNAITEAGTGNYRFYVSHNRGSVRVQTRDSQPLIDQVYPAIPCIYGDCFNQGQALGATTGSIYRDIDFALTPGASISGHLSDAQTGSPAGGYVDVYDAGFALVWSGDTDENGFYASGAWLPGTYYARAWVFTLDAVVCAFYEARPCPDEGGDPASVMPTPIVLSPGEVRAGIDFAASGDAIFASGFDP